MRSVSDTWSAEEVDSTRKIVGNFLASWKKEDLLLNQTFTIGVSSIGGGDIIGAIPGAVGSPGQYRYFDESDYLLGLAWERSFNQPIGGLIKGLAEAGLDNTSGRFLPHYMGGNSELFTSILPRRPFIINAGFHFEGIDQTIPQFSGIFTKTPRVDARSKQIDIEGADYADFFQNRYMDNEVMFTSKRSDVVIETMLQSMGMATSQYELDTGLNIIKFGLFERGTRFSDHINRIVQAENAHAYFDEEGIFRFENRQHWTEFPHFNVERDIFTAQVLEAESPRDDHIINVIEVVGEPREVEANQLSWDLDLEGGGLGVELPAGSRVEYWVNFNDPMFSIDTPGKLDITGTASRKADTEFKSPTATGEDHNDWFDPSNAFASDNLRASSGGLAGNKQDYYNFGLNFPVGATITGIELSAEASTGAGSSTVDYDLSWDGGTSYTVSSKGSSFSVGDATDEVGGDGDTWGRSWVVSEFSDSNFRVRINHKAGSNAVLLDHIQIKVYYDDPTEEQTSYYQANSSSLNDGTDITDDVVLINIEKFTQAAKLTLRNDSGSAGFLTKLVMWGRPARKLPAVYYRESIGNSVTAYEERPYKIENPYIQDISWAESFAKMVLQDYAYPENLQKITIRAIPELQLGDLVSWQGRHWRVFGIRSQLNASSGFVQELDLLQRIIQSYFRVGISTIGGSDVIAP